MKTFKNADILLPADADMEKWAVVACDQYTSEPEYWNKTAEITKGVPSAFNFILPEIYLEEDDVSGRISEIQKKMKDALSAGLFREYKNAMIYLERTQDDGKVRAGLVGCIDLEDYDYRKGSVSPVRATEATVIERIPPRIAVRRGAELELPHIMILIDDETKTVIEPLAEKTSGYEKVYDFTLMQKGGSVKGWLVPEAEQERILGALDGLADLDNFNSRYSLNESSPLVFAMGDGNHSLATAKEFYEELKKNNPGKDMSGHPARYALVELVNLHSPALEFEAIHRVLFGVNKNDILNKFKIYCAENAAENDTQEIMCYFDGGEEKITVKNPPATIAAGTLQRFLDEYIAANNCKIDYIHGADVTRELGSKPGNIGFVLPAMSKDELFKSVASDGVLPRKTFSMGEACDKRFYLEARKIL